MKLKFYILFFYFSLRNTAKLHLKYCTDENMKHRKNSFIKMFIIYKFYIVNLKYKFTSFSL